MAPDATADEDLVTLSLSPETICYIIVKARSRDAKDAVTDPDPGSDGPDDGMRAVLEDHPDDAVDEELAGAIAALNEAVSAAPGNAEAYCLRGLAYASSNGGTAARDAAIADYARCLELAPTGPLADTANHALTVLRAAAGH